MIILLEKLSQEVTRNGTFSTLTTWLEGNAARVKYGSELSNREQVITDAVGHLRSKLDEVIEGNKQEMTEKRQTLKRVKEIRTSAQDVETEEANIIKKVCYCSNHSMVLFSAILYYTLIFVTYKNQ